MEDQAIITLFYQRDETAIEEIRKKYGAYCYRIAYRILENREDAEECVLDTWLRAWTSIPPANPDSLSVYLGTIARNLSFDEYRRRHQKKHGDHEIALTLNEIEAVFSSQSSPEHLYDQKELSRTINAFLGTLSERDRDILLCRYYYVYPIRDIARKHNISYGYTQIILSRILKKLKKFMEKEHYL